MTGPLPLSGILPIFEEKNYMQQDASEKYFNELATTSRECFLPYIDKFIKIAPGMRVLEAGCGVGGNLLPFAEAGCWTVGVDIAEWKIGEAERLFSKYGAKGRFIASDFFSLNDLEGNFDLIICHDVIEHIADKVSFLGEMKKYLKAGGAVFMAFPAWQMPFGGHQQMCSSKILSKLPFIHLLPSGLYRKLLERGGETPSKISALMEIKETKCPVETFESVAAKAGMRIADRTLWLVNPHYKVKFGLMPVKLPGFLSAVPVLRDFLSTSCFYILGNDA